MKTIRRQLTLRLLLGLLLLVALFGGLLYASLARTLTDEFDNTLLAKARSVATLFMLEKGGTLEFEFSEDMMPTFHSGTNPDYFAVWSDDGRLLQFSGSFRPGDLPPFVNVSQEPRFEDTPLPSGHRGRVVRFAFRPHPDPDQDEILPPRPPTWPRFTGMPRLIIMMSLNRDPLDHLLARLSLLLLSLGLAFPLAIALVVLEVVRRGLRPLDHLGAAAAAMDTRNLGRRFAASSLPGELQPIAHRLNNLLERIGGAFQEIEAAYERERRFNDDVAHELRTPIAELHSLAEVALLYPGNPALGRKALEETLAISRQMEQLVAALLSLARCEAGIQKLSRETIDLGEALRQAWHSHEKHAATHGLACAWEVEAGLAISTDRAMLISILSNLVSNAVSYCPAGGKIRIQAARDEAAGGALALQVENANATLAEEDLPRLFDPFWQKDASRTDTGHSGLGLALVRAMCRVMGIAITARLPQPDRFAIELIFP